MTTWIRGRVVTIRAFPSFVTRPIAPFSAIGEVGARDPHVRLEELLPELLARRLDHQGDVGRDLLLELLREVLGHLETAQVDGGHHHVGRLLAGQGDDPLAQVRLGDGDPGGLQVLGSESISSLAMDLDLTILFTPFSLQRSTR